MPTHMEPAMPDLFTPEMETKVRAAVNLRRDQNQINTQEWIWLDAMLIEIDSLRDQVEGRNS